MKDLNVYDLYLKQMKNIVYLSSEEEKKLISQAKNGNQAAKNKVIESALHYVIKVAKSFTFSGVFSLEDLIGYGNIGLLKAFERFSPEKNVRFITYAAFWIHKEISDAIKNFNRFIRLPLNCEEDLSKIISIKDSLPQGMTENEQIKQISIRLGMAENHIENLLALSNYVKSTDETIFDGNEKGFSFIDKICDTENLRPDEYAENLSLSDFVVEMLDSLPEIERNVLVKRFGCDNQGVRSLKTVGEELGISKESVRNYERRALVKCRQYKGLSDFADYFAA